MTPPPDDPFLCACRREPTSRVPVWFMRQAGRSLPEYRALRGSGSIIDAIRNPDLATEITLQPVRRYGVDAAILYSDIVTPIAAIGFGVDVEPGVGPVVEHPFATAADLDRIRPLDAEADTPYVLETVHNLVGALGAVPLIGFAGAPFTVASYLVEGRPSRTYARTKALMHGDPELWFALVDRLADLAVASLRSQIAAGASAVQLFDSWAGVLSPPDYERFVLPASRKVLHGVADLGVPRIHFGVGTGEILTLMRDAGADVVGVDWRVPIDVARERLGDTVAVQGNLDPAILSAPWPVVEAQVVDVLDRNGGRPGHIFNLGHGVTPEVDPAVLERVVEVVHSYVPAGAGVTAGVNVNATVGVVVMAYGTPRSADDIQAYYTHIRRGRPPSDDQLANLQLRYRAIGGVSPLAERTESQRAGIQAALDEHAPGRFRVELGQKHSEPFIEDTADTLIRAGVHSIIGLVLAPHFSQASVGEYQQRLADAAEPSGLPVTGIEHWHMEEAYLAFLTDAVAEARATLPANHKVLFTAHSLPERVLVDDPYPDELRESAAEVAQRAGILDWADWSIGWQSAGATPEPWRGPDLLTVIRELGATGRTEGVCICPQGFVADHLEVLYDLDVEAAMVAAEVGLAYARTRSLNDDPTVMAALADRILGLATDAV